MATPPEDLERRIADSLRNRAGDITPSPELWTRVEATVNRSTRRTWAYAAAGVALATAAAVVVLPQVLDDEPTPFVEDPTPTQVAPTEAGTATEAPTNGPVGSTETDGIDASPSAYAILATDGEDVFLLDFEGNRVATFHQGDRDDLLGVFSVVVRPGGTATDFDAVIVFNSEGISNLVHLRVRNGEGQQLPIPQPQDLVGGSAPPQPAFSPDGRHLAWVEAPRDEQAQGPILRTLGWTDDGPGTGNPADDNASFTLTDLPNQSYRVEDWAWDVVGTETTGHLVLRANQAIETVLVSIDRQGDGALAVPGDVELLAGAVVDRAETGDFELPVIHELVVASDGTQDAEGITWTLVSQYEDGQVDTLLPLGPTADPGSGWLDAIGDRVVAGHGMTAVLVENGEVTPLDGSITFAALISND